MIIPQALKASQVTLLGYGALLSESSSRLTFPDLTNFRHVRVKGLKRVFAHPHIYLLKEGLLDPGTSLHLASLSAEKSQTEESSFVVAAFDVILDDVQRENFIRREPEYDIVSTEYYDLNVKNGEKSHPLGNGVICLRSKDENLRDIEYLHSISQNLKEKGGIWHWSEDSGLLPATIYLRHCLLAVEKAGGAAYESFLQETYLADRKTTLKEYMNEYGKEVMSSRPPSHLAERFGG